MKLLAASIAALTLLVTPALAEIKIGVVVSATGPGSSLGIPGRNAISLAPKEIGGEPVSENLANAMATLIRLPSSQRGGSRRIG